ncbi:MAG: hypothetical protein WCX74_02465 [Candidatus Paceibacterota bacterium]
MTIEIEIKDGMMALGQDAKVIIRENGKIIKEITARIGYQERSGGHYPCVRLEEKEVV